MSMEPRGVRVSQGPADRSCLQRQQRAVGLALRARGQSAFQVLKWEPRSVSRLALAAP
jgi:hypothetical protein